MAVNVRQSIFMKDKIKKIRCYEHSHLLNDADYHIRLPKIDKEEYKYTCKMLRIKHTSLIRHFMNKFVEENRKNVKKIEQKIKRGVNCVTGKLQSRLTPIFNHYELNNTTN